MPLVRISIPAGRDKAFTKAVSDSIQDAMVQTIDVPQADRFQIITQHAPGDLVVDPTYLDIDRGEGALIIQITMRSGRTNDKKRALYKTIAENLNTRLAVRKQDVVVTILENELIDWSFGNGEAQIAKD